MNGEISTHVSAPGSLTLFGEHAATFGEPAIALALHLRSFCKARISAKFTVNGEELVSNKHPYVRGALLQGWSDMDRPISFITETAIPHAWGLGTSSMTVACLGAISMLHDYIILEEVARRAFEVESEVKAKIASPLDTITSTYGSGIIIKKKRSDDFLWEVKNGSKLWFAHHCKIPDVKFVLGYTGIPSPAKEMRGKVKRFYEGNAFARDIVKDIGQISMEGADALRAGDLEAAGRMMSENQKLLVTLGVSHPALEKLMNAANRHSYGAKLTGAGGGGCILALTDAPDKTAEAIEQAGGQAHLMDVAKEGVKLEDEISSDP